MYAIVDIETTGGNAAYGKITEICILIHDGKKVIQKYNTLINPEQEIPPFITMLTGITNDMVEKAPKFYEVAKDIYLLLENKIFVVHNVGFDYSFIKAAFENLGGQFTQKKLCTVRLSRKLLPGLKSYSLGNLCASVGISVADRHRASGDAEATAKLFSMLLKKDPELAFIKHSLKKNSKETSLPPNISKEKFDLLPSETGVYFFHDIKGKIIYVGKANHIKNRVGDHFSGNTHTKTRQMFLSNIFDVSYQVTGSELIAYLVEDEAIKKHFPRYNRTNKSFAMNVGFYTYEDQNGYLRLTIGKCGKNNKPLLTFKNISEATTHALVRAKRHGLCLKLCALIESNLTCTYNEIEQTGHHCPVCHEQQSPEEYNKTFIEAFLSAKNERSFIIKTSGKTEDEEGFVLVEKGRFLGYGYIPKSAYVNTMEEVKDYLKSCYDTQDSQSIIESHLKKAKLVAQEPMTVYLANN